MGIVGVIGFAAINHWNWKAALSPAAGTVLDTLQTESLSVIPLFVLMGMLVSRAGLAGELYRASNAFLGHRRGGLSMATIVACGGFSAICGSSLATAATMAKVAMPQMRAFGYSDRLATASIAAGGTLGILIPPSVILIIYGIMTEQSIDKLFLAGIIPGLIGILFYLGAVQWTVFRTPEAGPAGERVGWAERFSALKDVWGIVLLFIAILGGIYVGIYTTTEAAGIGAGGALLIAYFRGTLTWRTLGDALISTIRTTAMLFTVLIGAQIFQRFIVRAGMPDDLLGFVTGFDVSPLMVIFLILLVYIILGCVFESLSMLLLTVPVFAPVVAGTRPVLGLSGRAGTGADLVRHHRRGGDRDIADNPARGAQCLRASRRARRRLDRHHLPRRHPVLDRRHLPAAPARAGADAGPDRAHVDEAVPLTAEAITRATVSQSDRPRPVAGRSPMRCGPICRARRGLPSGRAAGARWPRGS